MQLSATDKATIQSQKERIESLEKEIKYLSSRQIDPRLEQSILHTQKIVQDSMTVSHVVFKELLQRFDAIVFGSDSLLNKTKDIINYYEKLCLLEITTTTTTTTITNSSRNNMDVNESNKMQMIHGSIKQSISTLLAVNSKLTYDMKLLSVDWESTIQKIIKFPNDDIEQKNMNNNTNSIFNQYDPMHQNNNMAQTNKISIYNDNYNETYQNIHYTSKNMQEVHPPNNTPLEGMVSPTFNNYMLGKLNNSTAETTQTMMMNANSTINDLLVDSYASTIIDTTNNNNSNNSTTTTPAKQILSPIYHKNTPASTVSMNTISRGDLQQFNTNTYQSSPAPRIDDPSFLHTNNNNSIHSIQSPLEPFSATANFNAGSTTTNTACNGRSLNLSDLNTSIRRKETNINSNNNNNKSLRNSSSSSSSLVYKANHTNILLSTPNQLAAKASVARLEKISNDLNGLESRLDDIDSRKSQVYTKVLNHN
jgi:hypothetical protein